MKLALSVVLAGALLALAEAIPTPMSESEKEVLPIHEFPTGNGDFVPRGFINPFYNFNFFDDFFQKVAAHFRELTSNATALGTPTNSTSTQKVVDGHFLTVNETTYKGNNSFVHLKIVQIEPQYDSKELVEEHGEESKEHGEESKEHVEKSKESSGDRTNEISQGQIEEFTSQEINPAQDERLESHESHIPESYYDNSVDDIDSHSINMERDTYVNKIIEEKTRGGMYMVPSNVEVFDVKDGKPVESYRSYNPNTFRERTQFITV